MHTVPRRAVRSLPHVSNKYVSFFRACLVGLLCHAAIALLCLCCARAAPVLQTLGIPHVWASFVWLCGPISGLLVQPLVGVWSDSCRSPWGRRRPFIFSGALLVMAAVLIIGFSADLGYLLGDELHPQGGTRPMACALFVFGFWCLDLSNNTIQAPARALVADLTAPSSQLDAANAWYSFWMAVGSVMGYSTGAIGQWYM
ncbi:unnamed protein product [Closterium sp. NIES-54]